MERNSWKPIENFLKNLEVLKPIKTSIEEKSNEKLNIKAFIFDIYGTLIISDSGDVEGSRFTPEILEDAFIKADIPIHIEENAAKNKFLNEVLSDLKKTIEHIHKEKQENNIPFPEIDIIDVWEQVLSKFEKEEYISIPDYSDLRIYALFFELMSNRIYPMPNMKEVLIKLKSLNYPLGIISNAQFYTPVIMNYFLKDKVTDKEEIALFDPDLTFFSYKLGISKPDSKPFIRLKNKLKEKHQIEPEETLYIGNDMYKDIYPASRAGFKTALFAGDKRSLRLREDYIRIKNIQPDIIIKDLKTLFNFID